MEYSLTDNFQIAPIGLDAYDVCSIADRKKYGKFTQVVINSPEFGILTPPKYRLLTNRNHSSVQLANWALAQMASIHPDFYDRLGNEFISVYVPYRMLGTKALVKSLDAVAKGKLKADRLVIELSSDTLYEDSLRISGCLRAFRVNYGVKFMLSDFGGEYCPALRLGSFDFDYVITDSAICNEETVTSKSTVSAVNLAKENGAKVIFGCADEKLTELALQSGFDMYITNKEPVPDGRRADV